MARQLDLDLVEVAPDANPPVVRIMDYNRFKYETAQKAKESRKKATNTSVKEMKYRPKIGTGDFLTKTRQVTRFLEEGHKVKVTITFRGREVSHPELGMKILDGLVEQLASVAKVEAAPKLDGKNMTMVLAPDRRARPAQHKGAADDANAGVDAELEAVEDQQASLPNGSDSAERATGGVVPVRSGAPAPNGNAASPQRPQRRAVAAPVGPAGQASPASPDLAGTGGPARTGAPNATKPAPAGVPAAATT